MLDIFEWNLEILYLPTICFLVAYILFDVHYFIMLAFVMIWGKIQKKKACIEDTLTFYAICGTNELDIYLTHMNNARYMRAIDFARLHFFERTGLLTKMGNSTGLVAATNIRYRRPIPAFTIYKITTKILYYDNQTIYFEHHFITLNDNFIRAIVLSKQYIVGANIRKIINHLGNKDCEYQPECPSELQDWIDILEKSSYNLRKKSAKITE